MPTPRRALLPALILSLLGVSSAAPAAQLTEGLLTRTPQALADDNRQDPSMPALPRGEQLDFGTPPALPTGPLEDELVAAVQAGFEDLYYVNLWQPKQHAAIEAIAASGDPRLAWVLCDWQRIVEAPDLRQEITAATSQLLGITVNWLDPWRDTVDHLIAWDVPAPPGYLEMKRDLYLLIERRWEPLFVPGDIDWRHVSWGGVLIDDRPFGTTDDACECIPAADNPKVSNAAEATWLRDSDIVFGITVNGSSRAYPRRIMEVREMVNDTLGGRALGIPYCTLCASAQAYLTDELPEGVQRLTLRTSGLLIRSNKVMFDLNTYSIFDTFLGKAVTGPLAERGVQLAQVAVVTSSWGAWRAAHPDTTVLVEELALGRNFDFRNHRDANGPIFPIGDVDPRLPVQEDVLGVIAASGTPIAFHVKSALATLQRGERVRFENVRLVLDGDGVRAVDTEGAALDSHQAFWFAWSQFHPETALWPERADR